jgi:hypothetical protein
MNSQSLREQIMEHLVRRFEDIREGRDGFKTTWNVVVRRPMTKTEVGMGRALGLYDTDEVKTPQIGHMMCTMSVVCEFFYAMNLGDEPSTELNTMLTDIQRTMRLDVNCSGLSINIVEVRNELDIDGPADRLVAGVCEFQVQYRHSLDDPRNP